MPAKVFVPVCQLQAAVTGTYPFGEEAALDQELLDAIQWVTSRTPEQVCALALSRGLQAATST